MLKVPGTKVPDILFPHGEPSSRAFPIIIEPVIIIIEPETGPRRADCFFPHRHSHHAAGPDADHPDCALGDE